MPENPESGGGSSYVERPDVYKGGRAAARGLELLDEAREFLDTGDIESARSAVEIAAIQYLDVLWYTGGHPDRITKSHRLGSQGAKLAIEVGSKDARAFFPEAEVADDEDDGETERESAGPEAVVEA